MKKIGVICLLILAGITAFGQNAASVHDTLRRPDYTFKTDTLRISGDSAFVVVNALMHDSIVYRTEVIFLPNSCILHGAYVSWYANGQKRSKGTYRFGFKVNDWEYWDEAGNEIAGEAQKPH